MSVKIRAMMSALFVRKICAVAAMIMLLWHFIPVRSEADAIFLPFGGPIITVVPCDTGLWITVGPPVPASLMIMPGTLVYLHYALHPAALTLGNYDSVTVPCVVGIVPVGGGFHTLQIGTSL